MRARPVHNRASFVVCLHTLNLRKSKNPILVLLYFGKSPSPPVYDINAIDQSIYKYAPQINV
mgnify:CR=1 FL=1